MRSYRFIAAALLLPAWVSLAAAQAPAHQLPLTLEQALEQALRTNPGLRAGAFDLAISAGSRQQASALPNPELSILQEGTQRGTRSRSVELSQLVELGGKRAARIALAEREGELAAASLDLSRSDLRAEVSAAYFAALLAQERVRLAQASLDIAAKATLAADKRVAAGRVSPVEASRAALAQAGSRLELVQAQGEQAIALATLAAFWGETPAPGRTLAEPGLEPAALPPLETLRAQLPDSPQLRRARTQVAREDAQVSVERSLRMPDLNLTIGRKKDDDLKDAQTVFGVSVPLPLFNRNGGNLHASTQRAGKARAELDAERLRLETALAGAYRRAELAREQARSMQLDVLPAAQQLFDAAVTGFEAGKFNFLDVLDAQRTLLQSRTQYIQVLHERYRSIAELDRYTRAGLALPSHRTQP